MRYVLFALVVCTAAACATSKPLPASPTKAKAGMQWKIHARDIDQFYGASQDGSRVAVRERQPYGEVRYLVLDQNDDEVWEVPDVTKNCCTAPFVSPGGKWLGTYCGDEVRVFDFASGAIKQRFDVRALGADESSIRVRLMGGNDWILLPHENGWRVHSLIDGSAQDVDLPPEAKIADAMALSWDGQYIAQDGWSGLNVYPVGLPGKAIPPENLSYSRSLEFTANGELLYLGNDTDVDSHVLARIDPKTGEVIGKSEVEWDWYLVTTADGGVVARSVNDYPPAIEVIESSGSSIRLTLPPKLRFSGNFSGDGTGDGGAVQRLKDGRFVVATAGYGLLYFSASGELEKKEAGGPVRWIEPGPNDDQFMVGWLTGVRLYDGTLGTSEPLESPDKTPTIFFGAEFSGDGKYALLKGIKDYMTPDISTIVSSAGFKTPLFETEAECAISSTGAVFVCREIDEKAGTVTLVSRKLPSLEVVAKMQTKIDLEYAGMFSPVDVSPDGHLVAIGAQKWSAVLDITTRRQLAWGDNWGTWLNGHAVKMSGSALTVVDVSKDFDFEWPETVVDGDWSFFRPAEEADDDAGHEPCECLRDGCSKD